jgi:hypothetical protein
MTISRATFEAAKRLHLSDKLSHHAFWSAIAAAIDVTPATIEAFIPREALSQDTWPFNSIALRRWGCIAPRIRARAPQLGLDIGECTALAKVVACQL